MMQTSLRKMGNSTGMIVPRSILSAIGVTTGAAMDLVVEDGRLVATPVVRETRAGWAAAAATMHDDTIADEDAWRGFGNEDDADLRW